MTENLVLIPEKDVVCFVGIGRKRDLQDRAEVPNLGAWVAGNGDAWKLEFSF